MLFSRHFWQNGSNAVQAYGAQWRAVFAHFVIVLEALTGAIGVQHPSCQAISGRTMQGVVVRGWWLSPSRLCLFTTSWTWNVGKQNKKRWKCSFHGHTHPQRSAKAKAKKKLLPGVQSLNFALCALRCALCCGHNETFSLICNYHNFILSIAHCGLGCCVVNIQKYSLNQCFVSTGELLIINHHWSLFLKIFPFI